MASSFMVYHGLFCLFLSDWYLYFFPSHFYRYMEPLPAGSETKFEFENMIIGQAIPSNFIPHIEKGFREAANS